jgi:ABC-type polysaccharide/polyol phosphate transport system ATPase subunit
VGYDLNIGETIMDFFTAWSPPVPIIKKLAELHKDFTFRLEYYETGMSFRGITTTKWQDGEVLLEDTCWNMTDKDFEELGLL